ncbi:MAG: hypothetical protein RML40_12280, partial [Bacteroidota bacterium]|nr:hypothetical protein [Bacteroidota bacterium]
NGTITLHFADMPLPMYFGTPENREQKIHRIAALLQYAEHNHMNFKSVAYADVRWNNLIVLHPKR